MQNLLSESTHLRVNPFYGSKLEMGIFLDDNCLLVCRDQFRKQKNSSQTWLKIWSALLTCLCAAINNNHLKKDPSLIIGYAKVDPQKMMVMILICLMSKDNHNEDFTLLHYKLWKVIKCCRFLAISWKIFFIQVLKKWISSKKLEERFLQNK